MDALNEELTENQKKKIELVVQAVLDSNSFELRYFASRIQDKVQRASGVHPLKLNLDWPSLKQLGK